MIRLAKKIAESGVASRREAERLIKQGRVQVDGCVVTTPVFFVDEADVITVDDKPIKQKSSELIVWKMNKPRGYLTTRRDPKGRRTVFELFPGISHRLLYIGRLDYNSEGLLLFTNDGDFSRRLELPSTGLPRTYKVRFFGVLTGEKIRKLQNGIKIGKINYGKIETKILRNDRANNWALLTLKEGKNREIRRVLEYLDCEVTRLIRVSYGPIVLGDLPIGKVEKVTRTDLKRLIDLSNRNYL